MQGQDKERVAQQFEGNRMVRPTLRAKKPFKKNSDSTKGHEAFLKALETSGATISVELMDDPNPVIGTVKHSDKYTVSIQSENEVRVIFKHAMRLFMPLTPPPPPAAQGEEHL
jgi:sRNA-binding regulator protein Hfq